MGVYLIHLLTGQANKIIWSHLSKLGTSKEGLASENTSSQYRSERVQAEFNERAAEMARLQSQLGEIKQNYEKARTKLRDQAEVQGSLELANQELVIATCTTQCFVECVDSQ